ncbi:MAG: DUF29 domain-containing protein [Leptolyngbyaceae bacterium]|nr:DUF29 domain-containing protein [Leptolyngbyaceae bacterium]
MVINIEKRLAEGYASQSLYEQDFLLWAEDTVTKLKARDFENLDLENLIEEVESLGRSERKELASRLAVIFEHLLKRLYVNSPDDYHGWERTIRTQRSRLEFLLEDSPSLEHIWDERVARAWRSALKNVRKEYNHDSFPDRWPYESDIENILERDFWEK